MAEAGVPRPRTLSIIFGSYLLLEIGATALFVRRFVVASYPAAATAQILASYLVLGAASLVGACGGALRLEGILEDRVAEAEALPLIQAAPASKDPYAHLAARETEHPKLDLDTVALLASLQELSEDAEETARRSDPTPVASGTRPDLPQESPGVTASELARVREARDSVLEYVLGPILASVLLLGTAAALLPGSDGMLQADIALNAFVVLAGMEGLFGLAVYLAATFRAVLRAGGRFAVWVPRPVLAGADGLREPVQPLREENV